MSGFAAAAAADIVFIDTVSSDTKSQSGTTSCPDWGSSKTSCLSTTLQSCVAPCQAVVTAAHNVTGGAGIMPSSKLPDPYSTLLQVCGQQFSNMDACLHCSRRGFGLGAENLGRLLYPWSITCSTWMDHGPVRAYECWQGYAQNKTAACDATILLQVAANAGNSLVPVSRSIALLGLGAMALFGLNL